MLNAAKENGTIENIDKNEKVASNSKKQRGDVIEIGEEQDMLMVKIRSL